MDHPENEERLVYTAEEVAKLLQTNRAKVYVVIEISHQDTRYCPDNGTGKMV